jgi:hypothetical protein
MVFPRGEFSPEALKVLQANDYLAAVNTRALNNVGSERDLRIRDFLDVAVTGYSGVSVFLRRYPGSMERFAFDLFWGKPALAVEHHKYLRDGGKHLAQFVTRLNSLDKLRWGGLEDVLKSSYMQRVMSSGATACRFYSNTQTIRNDTSENREFTATKHCTDDIPIATVLVNGQSIDYANEGDCVRMEFNVPAFSTAEIEIQHRNLFPCTEPEHRLAAASRIFARRMLSECRDNLARVATSLFSTTAGTVRD